MFLKKYVLDQENVPIGGHLVVRGYVLDYRYARNRPGSTDLTASWSSGEDDCLYSHWTVLGT